MKKADIIWGLATLGFYNYQSSQSTRARMKEELRIRNGGRQTDLEFFVQTLQRLVRACVVCLGVVTLITTGIKIGENAKEFSRGEGRLHEKWVRVSKNLNQIKISGGR